MNPLFIEYYPHEKCDYYKICNPWSKYSEGKIALCPVTHGIEYAKFLASKIIAEKLTDCLNQSTQEKKPEAPCNRLWREGDYSSKSCPKCGSSLALKWGFFKKGGCIQPECENYES